MVQLTPSSPPAPREQLWGCTRCMGVPNEAQKHTEGQKVPGGEDEWDSKIVTMAGTRWHRIL